jgi:hypothetical protein
MKARIREIIKHVEDGDIDTPNNKMLSEYICELITEALDKKEVIKFKYKNEIYPAEEYIDNLGDGQFTTIAPQYNGDYILINCHSSDGVTYIEDIANEDVEIIKQTQYQNK